MMKKGIKIGICLALAFAVGITAWLLIPKTFEPTAGDTAQVDGVFITEAQVNTVMQYNQIQMETYEKLFFDVFATEEEAQKNLNNMALRHPTDKNGVVNYLIRAQVLWEYLKEQGKEISKEEAIVTYNQEVSALSTENKDGYYTVLQQVLTAHKTTMDEFVAMGKEYCFFFYNTTRAKSIFNESDEYDSDSSLSLDEQFSAFAKELEEKADIQRFSE